MTKIFEKSILEHRKSIAIMQILIRIFFTFDLFSTALDKILICYDFIASVHEPSNLHVVDINQQLALSFCKQTAHK